MGNHEADAQPRLFRGAAIIFGRWLVILNNCFSSSNYGNCVIVERKVSRTKSFQAQLTPIVM